MTAILDTPQDTRPTTIPLPTCDTFDDPICPMTGTGTCPTDEKTVKKCPAC